MAVPQPRHRFTVHDYHRMGEAGIFDGQRVELIEGEIVDMSPIGSRHNACVNRLAERFFRGLGDRAIVQVQGSVRLSDYAEPQSDIVLLHRRADYYAAEQAGPQDILLLVEVADTTVRYDLDTKVPLYARSGIPEVWVADITGERVVVHREPGPRGYREVFEVRGEAGLSPRAFPDLLLTADQIVGGLA